MHGSEGGKRSGAMRAVKLGLIVLATLFAAQAVARQYAPYQAWRNHVLAEPRAWPELAPESFQGATLTLTTRWQDAALHYDLVVRGYPPAVQQVMEPVPEGDVRAPLTLFLHDDEGTEILRADIPRSDLRRVISAESVPSGIRAEGVVPMPDARYRAATRWSVRRRTETGDAG